MENALQSYGVEMCVGMGIQWESHGNGNKTRNWGWEWEGMGKHLSGNGNYLHSHGNLFPQNQPESRLDQLVAVSSQQYEAKT